MSCGIKLIDIIFIIILCISIGCHGTSPDELTLFDFESDKDLDEIHWECHTLFSLSSQYATHGTKSLKMELYPASYPGLKPDLKQHDWSKYTSFRFDIYNPAEREISISLRIDDKKDSNDYADRYNERLTLKPGMNQITIQLDSLTTSGTGRKLNLESIYRFLFFAVSPTQKITLYIDNIRLVN
jgi:hypothetical protein